MGFLTYLQLKDVRDFDTFTAYCQQRLGIPPTYGTTRGRLRREINQFFDDNPTATYQTLAKVVDYCANRSRRYATPIGIINFAVGEAFAAGYLPELAPSKDIDSDLEKAIEAALTVETDPLWVNRFYRSRGVTARREVYESWVRSSRSPVST